MTIRDARPDEVALMSRLTRRAYSEYRATMAPSAWSGLNKAVAAGLASSDPVERIVAESDGRIVGSVMLFPAFLATYGGATRLPWPELRLLAVDPVERGKGIGRALVDECVRRATAVGAVRLGLHTSASMRAARDMYRRMGFERAPQYDFEPPGGELVEAYTIELPITSERGRIR